MISFLMLAFQVFHRFNNGQLRISKLELKYILWTVFFILLGALSAIWSLKPAYASSTAVMLAYSSVGVVALLLYLKDKDNWIRAMNVLLIASIYMMILIVLHMGDSVRIDIVIENATQLYFNTVSQILAFLIVFAFFMASYLKKKIYYLYMIPAYAIILYSGSRKSLIFPIVVIGWISLMQRQGLKSKLKKILLGILVVFVLVLVIQQNEVLSERLVNLVLTLLTDSKVDESALERAYYRQLAISMFFEKPFLGYGLSNFQAMLENLRYGHIAYSHNNWTEIASNLGIFGLVTYYWYYFYLIFKNWKGVKSNNFFSSFIVVVLVVFMIFEYGIVSYGIQFYRIIFAFLTALYAKSFDAEK